MTANEIKANAIDNARGDLNRATNRLAEAKSFLAAVRNLDNATVSHEPYPIQVATVEKIAAQLDYNRTNAYYLWLATGKESFELIYWRINNTRNNKTS